MPLRGSQNKNGVGGRLFQGLLKGIEGRVGEHVHLIYNIDFVLAGLRGVAHLVYQVPDIVYRVVAGRIELVPVKRAVGGAAFAVLQR